MSYYARIARIISDLNISMANVVRFATVKQVQGDKMIVTWAKDAEGKDVDSPWINYTTMRGGAMERRFFATKNEANDGNGITESSGSTGSSSSSSSSSQDSSEGGQNVVVIVPNGRDWERAIVLPGAPNKHFKGPSHGAGDGKDEEAYQLGDLRILRSRKDTSQSNSGGQSSGGQQQQKKNYKYSYSIWLQKDETQQQSSELQQLPEHKDDSDKDKARVSLRITDGGGEDGTSTGDSDTGPSITGRVGKNRVAVNAKGAKLESGGEQTLGKGLLGAGESSDQTNIVTVTKDEINVKTNNGKVFIDSKADMHIKGGAKIYMSGGGEVHVSGQNVRITGSPLNLSSSPHILTTPMKLGGQSAQAATGGSDKVPNDNNLNYAASSNGSGSSA